MSFGTAYATKKHNKKCMAKGGEVKFHHPDQRQKHERGVNTQDTDEGKRGESIAGVAVRSRSKGAIRDAKYLHRETLQEARAIHGPTSGKSGFAHGGEVDEMGEYDPIQNPMPEENESANMEDADMIARIMHKRNQYAKGGEVANDVGVSEADKLPAEFDDLVLDDSLEDDSGAGNEIGDARVHDDMVDRIMLKKKKDKLPRPA